MRCTRGLILLLALGLGGCVKHAEVKEISPEQVAAGLAAGKISVFDANTPAFREKYGTVPGAVLLSNYEHYDLSVLGADKSRPLVFYCTNRL